MSALDQEISDVDFSNPEFRSCRLKRFDKLLL
jgi:hypothetical protein